MMNDGCAEMRLLIQANVDGELSPSEAAQVGAHLDACPSCTDVQMQLVAISGRMRREVPYYPASEALRAAVQARLAAVATPDTQDTELPPPVRRSWWQWLPRPRLRLAASFGAGFALAACLVLALVLPRDGDLPDAVVAGHIRALQPGHLMDVTSTDQHTVKPWFDGRLDFAPPVKDFKTEGFPLAGARLDYLAGRPVAVLIYQRRQHVVEVFVQPAGKLDHGPVQGSQSGYNFLRWKQDGMAFWAVSDLGAPELADFVRLWQAG